MTERNHIMEETSEYIRLKANMQKLKMTKMAEYLPQYMEGEETRNKSSIQIMRELMDVEIRFRDERAADMNLKLSNFPYRKTLDDFDYDYQPSVDRKAIQDLRTLEFIETGDNVLFIGTSGVGKTHLATGLGVEAATGHISTYFIHFHELIGRLRKAAEEGREEYTIRNLNKYKLLIIDEIGYFPVDRTVAGLFFQLVAARYEKRSIIITTNQPLSKWGEVFGDAVIANAIIDRLVHHARIIRITGRSYRIKNLLEEQAEVMENVKTAPEPLGVLPSMEKKRGRPKKIDTL